MKRLSSYLGLIAVLLSAVALVTPAHGQERQVVVQRRDGRMEVATNGDVRVVETWQVRFVGGPFRFAFRSIPLNRVDAITDVRVAEPGQAFRESSGENAGTFEVDQGSEVTITWYFSPTSNSTRTFVLEYTLRGALRIYPDGDQIFWKFIEADREYPIQASRVLVSLPADFRPEQLTGADYLNGTPVGGMRTVDSRTVEFRGGPFGPGDEWEIRAQFPHGVVTANPAAWQTHEDRAPIYNLVALALALVIALGGLLGIYLLWYARGRDRAATAGAEYWTHPPEDLPAPVAGTLLDERAEMRDILAAIVDLGRRGYIQIVQMDEGRDGSAEFKFVRLRGDDGSLRPYERILFQHLFGFATERDLYDLREKFYKALPELQASLYEETVNAGYFPASPQRTRNLYTALGIALAVIGGLLGFMGYAAIVSFAPLAILPVAATALVGVVLAIAAQAMPRKTAKGAAAAVKWRAFKRYLAHVDRYTELDQAKDRWEEYLPYAVAFGLEKEWVKTFETVDVPAPRWYRPYPTYYPYGPVFSTGSGHTGHRSAGDGGDSRGGSGMPSLDTAAGGAFSGLNAMSAGFFTMLDSASSTFTSTPAPSGGSGGGFSGGGSGGGGGGGGSSGFG